jgi:hypothetical protein
MVLFFYLTDNKLFHFVPVKLHQETCKLLHDLIKRRVFSVLQFFSCGISILINHNQDFLGFGHLKTDNFHDFVKYLGVNRGKRLLVGYETVSKVLFQGIGVLEFIKVLADVKVEELDGDLEHLIVVQFHHHEHILESSITNLNALLIAVNCDLEPSVLGLEEL